MLLMTLDPRPEGREKGDGGHRAVVVLAGQATPAVIVVPSTLPSQVDGEVKDATA